MKMMLREIQTMLSGMQPGALRDQMQADVTCLKVRLLALPARVAAHAPFPDAREMREVLDREITLAFGDVTKWMR